MAEKPPTNAETQGGGGFVILSGDWPALAAVASYQKVPAGPSQHTSTLSLISLFFFRP